MSDPSTRMLRLLSLLQTHRFWEGPELARELTISERTLRRDVERLRSLGYPVDAARGTGGGYQLRAGQRLPPLLLDDEDAVAIAVGLRTAAVGTVQGIEEASVRALAKLEQVLPPGLHRRIAALQEAIVLAPRSGMPVDSAALVTISQACRDRERLRFDYVRKDGERADRTVEPHRLVSDHGRWYLVGWCLRRDDWRTFRVDRMTSPAVTGTRFVGRSLPRGQDAASYVRESMQSQPMRWEASIRVACAADALPSAATWWRGRVEPIDDESCRIRTSADDIEWLTVHLMFLDADYVVEGPPELVDHLRATAGRIGRGVASGRERSGGD
jgi:predicted DNA-binding transcriptional regulator YafY